MFRGHEQKIPDSEQTIDQKYLSNEDRLEYLSRLARAIFSRIPSARVSYDGRAIVAGGIGVPVHEWQVVVDRWSSLPQDSVKQLLIDALNETRGNKIEGEENDERISGTA